MKSIRRANPDVEMLCALSLRSGKARMLITSPFVQQCMSGPRQHRNTKDEQAKGTGRKKQICHDSHVVSSIILKAHKEFSDLLELVLSNVVGCKINIRTKPQRCYTTTTKSWKIK